LAIILFLFISLSTSFAQLAMGKWRTHIAYDNVTQVAQSEDKIYALSEGALYSITKTDGSIELYSKLTGLNDVIVSRIEFNKDNKQMVIVYNNGNIDILSSSGISNMPDLYNKQMTSSKTVNDIYFYDSKAYLSCDFGILVINLQKKEVIDTYYIGANASEVKVLNTTILNNKIYALSTNNVYIADTSSNNLANYEYWSTTTSFPGSGEYKKIFSFNDELLLFRGNKMYLQGSNGSWSAVLNDLNVASVYTSLNKLFVQDENNQLYLVNSDYTKKQLIGVSSVSDAEYDDEEDVSWLATTSGVVSYNEDNNAVINTYKPNGPAVNSPWNMTFSGEKLYVVPGGRSYIQYLKPGHVMIFENETWSNIYNATIKASTNGPVSDFMNTAIDPNDNTHFFVTSFGNGLFEFRENTFYKWHNYLNSTIESVVPNDPYNYMRLDGAIFDKDGNLLLCNMSTNSAIKILTKDGEWTELTYSNAANETLGQILISNQNQNQKWIPSVRLTPGIFIFDDGGTLTDQNDDNSEFLSTFIDSDNEGSTISPTNFYCLAQDKNGVIWAGTEQGPLLFYNTNNAFKTGYTCSRVKIPRNDGTDKADYLLLSEKIKCIAIDGANRKWLGTEGSGVYLMSEDGLETVKHFTNTNSPLLSNNIFSIAINPVTGEVFIGTDQGLVSYQSDASEAGSTFTNVHAYPNPVRNDYSGIITITGLVEDTQLKITDITGNLVCQTTSNGSIATWNGKDFHGKKVSTGIYLVICVNSDGTQNTITKVMIIN